MTSGAPLYVIAPLSVSAEDRARIEAIRRECDPQASLVEAHVTFVFGAQMLSLEDMTAHVTRIAAATPPIAFHLDQTETARDYTGVRSHVFLIPSDGEAAMRGLHGALYSGVLAAALRADIPYVPHVTVAAMEDHGKAQRLAEAIAAAGLSIRGRLERLDIVAFDGAVLDVLRSCPLAG